MPTCPPPQSPSADRQRTLKASQAEVLVKAALQRQGWTILGQNLRHIGYELDLVAAKGATLAVVEVKARARRPQTGQEREALLPPAKRRALQRGAEAFLTQQSGDWVTVRFDLAVVYPDPGSWRQRIEYYVDVLDQHAG